MTLYRCRRRRRHRHPNHSQTSSKHSNIIRSQIHIGYKSTHVRYATQPLIDVIRRDANQRHANLCTRSICRVHPGATQRSPKTTP